jgi:hypothetical protein
MNESNKTLPNRKDGKIPLTKEQIKLRENQLNQNTAQKK